MTRAFKHPDESGTVVRVDDSVADDLAKDDAWEEVDLEETEPKPVTTESLPKDSAKKTSK